MKTTPPTPPRAGYSINETATTLGVCRATVYNQIAKGNLRTFKVGRRRLVSPAALDDLVRKGERDAA